MSQDVAEVGDAGLREREETTVERQEKGREDFWLLLITFLSFRLLSLLLFRPGGFIRDWSDFDTFLGIAVLSDHGLYPYLHFWLEWPPLVPWLMVGAYRLSLLIPLWEDPRLGFILILGTAFVLFEVGNFILIGRIARRLLPEPALVNRVLWLYAGLFPPVYAMLGFFDGVALFFILLSLELILARRLSLVGLALGVGFLTKIVPILMLPVAFKSAWQRWRVPGRVILVCLGLLLATGATIGLLLLPFALIAPQWLLAFSRALVGRSSWETVWAVLEGYYGFGFVAGERLNPAETTFAIHPAILPWGIISLAFVVLYAIFFIVRADFERPRHVTAFAGLTVVIFLLYSKGYSPQFLVYLLPFVILLLPNLAGLGYALLLTLLNILEQPIYFVIFPPDQFPEMHWLLTVIVVARFVVLVALAVEFLLILDIWQAPAVQSGLRWALTGATVVGVLLLIPRLGSAYEQVQLTRSPYRPLITFLRTQTTDPPAALLLTEGALYRQLYPHLHRQYNLKLVGDEAGFAAAPDTAQLIEGELLVWFLPSGPQAEAVAATMNALARPVSLYRFDNLEASPLILFDVSGANTALTPLAQAENGVELVSYQLEVDPSALDLTLYWQTEQLQDTSYTVFSQLLDSSGRLVAGHDGIPGDGTQPTILWKPNYIIPDTHHIPLPSGLPPGSYQLIVGMYDSTNTRLPFLSAGQEPFTDDAIPLRTLTLSSPASSLFSGWGVAQN